MHCQDCPRYDHEKSACKDGKLNPQYWDQAVDIANIFGARAVCVFNDHRERLLQARAAPESPPSRSE